MAGGSAFNVGSDHSAVGWRSRISARNQSSSGEPSGRPRPSQRVATFYACGVGGSLSRVRDEHGSKRARLGPAHRSQFGLLFRISSLIFCALSNTSSCPTIPLSHSAVQ